MGRRRSAVDIGVVRVAVVVLAFTAGLGVVNAGGVVAFATAVHGTRRPRRARRTGRAKPAGAVGRVWIRRSRTRAAHRIDVRLVSWWRRGRRGGILRESGAVGLAERREGNGVGRQLQRLRTLAAVLVVVLLLGNAGERRHISALGDLGQFWPHLFSHAVRIWVLVGSGFRDGRQFCGWGEKWERTRTRDDERRREGRGEKGGRGGEGDGERGRREKEKERLAR